MHPVLTTAKYNSLLPLFSNNAYQVEKDLISRLNKDLFSTHKDTNTNAVPMVTTSLHSNIKHEYTTPMPSPPRSPITMDQHQHQLYSSSSPPRRSNMITPPPELDPKRELMTIASKVPLFRKRKNNYINKGVAISGKGPVVMKLCKINYTTSPAPQQQQQATAPPQIPINITIPSTKERKFRCKTCSMAFTTSGHLSRHNKIHTGERNFTCPYDGCVQKFSRHDNCLQHYRTHLKKEQKNKRK